MAKKISRLRVGTDTGGTFTDFVFAQDGSLRLHKLPTTPEDPSLAVARGIVDVLGEIPRGARVVHGTTQATNAFLMRRGARTALITTRGFRDVVFIGRQTRRMLYSLRPEEPAPIIPPEAVFEVNERTSFAGDVVQRPTKREIARLARRLRRYRPQAAALSFLHSYRNPANELLVANSIVPRPVVSSELVPEFREYERTVTTLISAYLGPVLKDYLKRLSERLAGNTVLIQQSSGGYLTVDAAADRAVSSILSGPAGGLAGASRLAGSLGLSRIITLDMGGTSTDVALVDGSLPYTREYRLDGYPLAIQMLDIHTVGAGGGSIAWVDRSGALKVGPGSAGADPGPACYGKSRVPTVTDANLALGRLLPDLFLGGRMKLFPERARSALKELAGSLGAGLTQSAAAIIDVVNQNMARALSAVSLERGHDPADFTLVCLGGASGLHACSLARELGINRILVPRAAGVASALGLITSPPLKEFPRTILASGRDLYKSALLAADSLIERGKRELAADGLDPDLFEVDITADLRYLGQSYELSVPLGPEVRELFNARHHETFGHSFPEKEVEAVTVRAWFRGPEPGFPSLGPPTRLGPARNSRLYFMGQEIEVPVVDWASLGINERLKGPALVVEESHTLFVEPGFGLKRDPGWNLFLERSG